MIFPKHSKFHGWLLTRFLEKKFKSNFSKFEIVGKLEMAHDKSILLIGNHATWWDGFIGWHLNQTLFKKNFHILMLEEQLKRFWFFQYCGAFGIQPNSRKMIKSLEFGKNILENHNNLLQFFPQGKFYSIYDMTPAFKKGIEKILIDKSKCQIIFYGIFFEFFENEKPILKVYLEEFKNMKENISKTDLELAFHQFLQNCCHTQKTIPF
jgi:hypothetical protein